MKIKIQTTENELLSKTDKFVQAISQVVDKVNPELGEALLKALPKKDELFSDPVQLELLKQWEMGYKEQIELMLKDIEKVLNGKTVFKSEDDGISYFHFDEILQDYVENSNSELSKSQPYYIGPRGGKWLDAAHTKPWREEDHPKYDTGERYDDDKVVSEAPIEQKEEPKTKELDNEIKRYKEAYSDLFANRPKRLKADQLDTQKTKDLYIKYTEARIEYGKDSIEAKKRNLEWIKSRDKDIKEAISNVKTPKKELEKKKASLTTEQDRQLYDMWKEYYYDSATQLAKNVRLEDHSIDVDRNQKIATEYAMRHQIPVFYQGKGGFYKVTPNDKYTYDIDTGTFHSISNPFKAAEKVELEGGVWLPKKSLEADTPKEWGEWREENIDKVKEEPKPTITEPVKPEQPKEIEPSVKRKRGRPPGSKNKPKEVIPKIEAINKPKEQFVITPKGKRGRPPKPENVKQAEKDLSTVSAKNIKLKKLKSDAVHDIYKPSEILDEDDARIAMRNLRDAGINVVIIPGEDGVVKIRKGFDLDRLENLLSKAL